MISLLVWWLRQLLCVHTYTEQADPPACVLCGRSATP